MHRTKYVIKNLKLFSKAINRRKVKELERIISIIVKLNLVEANIQNTQREKNKLVKKILIFLKEKKFLNKECKRFSRTIKTGIKCLALNEKIIYKKLNIILLSLPNIIGEEVPTGYIKKNKIILRRITCSNRTVKEAKSHYEIGLILKNISFKSAIKISGTRFVILKKNMARLERILAYFMLDVCVRKFKYIEIAPPILVKESTMINTGQLPKFNDSSFKTTNGYRLIPTAEVPLTAILESNIIKEYKLPINFTANTPCFRSETGGNCKESKGMIRMHQFYKVELVSIVKPKKSKSRLEKMLAITEFILQKLGLSYRVVFLCSNDLGFCSSKTYDLEVLLTHDNKYKEISSCSNCLNFQSVRMKTRYKTNSSYYFTHTLNASALAVGRTMAAIIESYQKINNCVIIPKVLEAYMKIKAIETTDN